MYQIKGRLLILNVTLLKGRLWNVQEMERIYVKCKEHDKAFTSAQLILHAELTRKQTGEKSFKCAMCDKEFTISRKLTAHMTGEKLYKCKESLLRVLIDLDLHESYLRA